MTDATTATDNAHEPPFFRRMMHVLLVDELTLAAAIFRLFILALTLIGSSQLGD